jgi:predicted phosphoribosyltransferase
LLTQELSLLLLRTIGRPCRPERCLCVIASSWNRQ